MAKQPIEAYLMGLRYINPRNKSGLIKLVFDMIQDHPQITADEVIEKLYPERE